MIKQNKTVAAIMAHSDDIDIFAGGTFAKYTGQGYKGLYGVMSRCNSGWTVTREKGGHYISSLEIVPQRRKEAEAAAQNYGAELYYGDLLENCYTTRDKVRIVPSFQGAVDFNGNLSDADDFPAGTLLAVEAGAGGEEAKTVSIINDIAELLIKWQPELVIGQYFANNNPDHFNAALILAKAWQKASKAVKVGPYLIPVIHQEEGFIFPPLAPNRFIDITGYEQKCLDGIACHKSQGGEFHYTKRITGNWQHWGKMNNCANAEAFYEVQIR
ncbi:MAG TPA: hypothetical protein DC049_12470 [Spirochaetia bacterium]|nr:hypothetical protein [Spirochaetia bacterium]